MPNLLKFAGFNERQQPETGKKQRLVGLDLFRGIAALAVVILHADEGVTVRSPSWSIILNFSDFAVPFFLAASFYLTLSKLTSQPKSPDWSKKISRLLIPYGFWSLVYLSQNILRSVLKHRPEQLHELFHNSLGLILLGQAKFHLYFIPLLVTGILIVIAVEPLIRKQFRLLTLLGYVGSSWIIYQSYRVFMAATFDQAVSVGAELEGTPLTSGMENQLLFTLLRVLGFAVRCLPYITIALFLNHPSMRSRLLQFTPKATLLLLIIFVVLNSFTPPLLLQAVHESCVGYSALLLGLALSNQLPGHRLIQSIGHCSFGIYLMHLLWVEMSWSLLKRIGLPDPVPILMPLLVVILAFSASWMATSLLMKQKFLSRVMFGVS